MMLFRIEFTTYSSVVFFFYREQYHSEVTWKEFEKLFVLQLQIHRT